MTRLEYFYLERCLRRIVQSDRQDSIWREASLQRQEPAFRCYGQTVNLQECRVGWGFDARDTAARQVHPKESVDVIRHQSDAAGKRGNTAKIEILVTFRQPRQSLRAGREAPNHGQPAINDEDTSIGPKRDIGENVGRLRAG